ncbi:hypothetical protein [Vulcanisaeta sp. JCM 16159]|uniref:hypothetical protein n=1 Tax=Vulcanisaeta sp. JCM 16159 TaxID=1295371 RepID=UPI0006D26E05|nr:hypothetical protein [Vulcanisaeta sp. JCM 16159]
MKSLDVPAEQLAACLARRADVGVLSRDYDPLLITRVLYMPVKYPVRFLRIELKDDLARLLNVSVECGGHKFAIRRPAPNPPPQHRVYGRG